MRILVTGGAGYIGSHTTIELISHGHEVAIIDNLSNSSAEAVRRVEEIAGTKIPFYKGDVQNRQLLEEIFTEHHIEAVIHFAGLKSVNESVQKPLQYYENNIDSSLVLCEVMQKYHVKKLIFSSTAAVYGEPEELPIKETNSAGQGITNPYGRSKYMIEQILSDVAHSDPTWQITALRYFNPIGAHTSGRIGEDPHDIPNNLLPYVAQVAVGRLPKLHVFGNDYPTPDGTGVRDYIHVVDLARGHLAALEHLQPGGTLAVFNLGTGHGVSVLDMVHAFEKASGKTIAYDIVDRRPGDVASCYADPSKAQQELAWHTEKTLDQACLDAWRWQSQNPDGYRS